MSHIGIATAMGQAIDIPIVLRSLAGSFSLVNEDVFPISFHPDILTTLDTPPHPKCGIVKNYKLRWWTGRKPRDLNTVEKLNSLTIKSCVEHYRQERLDAGSNTLSNTDTGAGTGAGTSTQRSTGPLIDDISGPAVIATGAASGAASGAGPSSQTSTGAFMNDSSGPVCINCAKYRQLLSDVLQDVLKFKNFASTMSTCSENLLNIGIRRASTFNLLHEAAILKETAGLSLPSRTLTARSISEVSRIASSELERLRNLPASSYKWTWGETLTKKDVLDLRRTGTNPGRVAHSGYDVSLVDGKQDGWYSEVNSTNLSAIGQYDDVPAEASLLPPPTDLRFPNYFYRHDPRSYDPLNLSTASIPLTPVPGAISFRQLNDSTSSSESGNSDNPAPVPGCASTINLADNWSSGSGSVKSRTVDPAPNVLDLPISGPEFILADVLLPAPVPDFASVINLADNWISGPGSDEGDTPAPGSGVVALGIAEAWSDNEVDNDVNDNAVPSGPLKLADEWKDSDMSGDEAMVTDPSSLLRLAEEWKDSDSGNEISPSGQSEKEWSYGPQHFSFLNDNMFEFSSDEDN